MLRRASGRSVWAVAGDYRDVWVAWGCARLRACATHSSVRLAVGLMSGGRSVELDSTYLHTQESLEMCGGVYLTTSATRCGLVRLPCYTSAAVPQKAFD